MSGYPSYLIQQNMGDSHQTSPGTTVLFVRYKEPTSMYNPGNTDLMATKDIETSIVENDCIGVSINNDKGDFNKSCTLTLKVTDTVWQNAVSPGDWVFVWLSPDRTDTDRIATILHNVSPNQYGNRLCSWDSALKFFGRVVQVATNDVTAPTGTRTVHQTVTCQAFLELATSIYYTYVGTTVPDPAAQTPSDKTTPEAEQQSAALRKVAYDTRMDRALRNIADKFLQIYQTSRELTPDSIIGYLFALIMGVPNVTMQSGQNSIDAIAGSVSDAIKIPSILGNILARPNAQYLWQLYNLYLGVQKYDSTGRDQPWQGFMPRVDLRTAGNRFKVFLRSPGNAGRCKGVSPFYPPYWTNETMWSIMSQYLNPVVNEMYTSLRVNMDNAIGPSIIVREKPYSTGLRNFLQNTKVLPLGLKQNSDNSKASFRNNIDTYQQKSLPDAKPATDLKVERQQGSFSPDIAKAQKDSFTFYSNLPRWLIDPGMVKSLSSSTSESDRINFVQVWGRNGSAEILKLNINPKALRQAQITSGNAVSDDQDIQRNGLRADISESQWDFFISGNESGSWAPDWAKMRADWMFNGHLKLKGTLVMNGVREPICEGDNLQINGIVYHIESVSHSYVLDAGGRRSFSTTCALSRGVRALKLNETDAPLYGIHQGHERVNVSLPGVSILQEIEGVPRKSEG